MMASFASSSRISVGRLNQLCSTVESCYLGESVIRTALLRNSPARSSIALGKQREVRQFSSAAKRRSAWAAGHDVDAKGMSASTDSAARTSLPSPERSVTVGALADLKLRREPIAVLTAYDYSSALSIRGAPVDICLVGDSLANVALGFRTTHSLSLEAMIHHVQAVARGLRHPLLNQQDVPPIPLLIADLPYGFAQGSLEAAVKAATMLVQQGGADGIKVEGTEEVIPLVHRLASFGMPVMAHIGLQPQRATSSSDFQLQARTATQAISLLQSAIRLQEAGAFSAVLECIPSRVGTELSKRLQMATIGIGGGKGCDGQVLVADDMLGECTSPLHVLAGISLDQEAIAATSAPVPSKLWPNPPRFARNFVRQLTGGSSIGAIRLAAVQAYVKAVKDGSFPADEEGYKMKKEEWAAFKTLLEDFDKTLLL